MKYRSESNYNLYEEHHSWTNPFMSESLIYTDTEVTLLKFIKLDHFI